MRLISHERKLAQVRSPLAEIALIPNENNRVNTASSSWITEAWSIKDDDDSWLCQLRPRSSQHHGRMIAYRLAQAKP